MFVSFYSYQPFEKYWLLHKDIVNGGTLELRQEPNENRAGPDSMESQNRNHHEFPDFDFMNISQKKKD